MKIEKEALQAGRVPVFSIYFENPEGLANDIWVAFPLDQVKPC